MDEDASAQQEEVRFILPSRQKRAGNRHLDLLLQDEDDHELGFMARLLVQATIPHSDPGPIPLWGRQNGDLTMHMQPGWEIVKGQPRNVGLPYGSVPRLLLAWATTEAARTKERELVLGESLSEFMGKLGMVPHGGRWGNVVRLREQMRRLFSATIVLSHRNEQMHTEAGFRVADKTVTFWDPKSPQQAALWRSTVTLSEPFYTEVVTHPVPIDLRVLKALTRSPMAIDIYMWLTYRMSYLKRPITIPWEALETQFGADYKHTYDFRKKFLKALEKVLLGYPVNVAKADTGLLLAPSRTHIPRRT
jgi:hypothetical protein